MSGKIREIEEGDQIKKKSARVNYILGLFSTRSSAKISKEKRLEKQSYRSPEAPSRESEAAAVMSRRCRKSRAERNKKLEGSSYISKSGFQYAVRFTSGKKELDKN